ncbi:hypothetical protein FDJ19_gp146 [Vibrio phage Ceto]|uniref:Uncharacterized protein n=1 Tax=Vibrio phage Ceto TaxID=2570300 RepID=A0A2H5BGN2_9CAUD|nr:hypothetical protein FDJ19_gp146 [Vibrio phage Ceto]AUG85152.1 hypothetical protein CETO_170 [Vibrio phage Ceto]
MIISKYDVVVSFGTSSYCDVTMCQSDFCQIKDELVERLGEFGGEICVTLTTISFTISGVEDAAYAEELETKLADIGEYLLECLWEQE